MVGRKIGIGIISGVARSTHDDQLKPAESQPTP
jgi:hypothetical protein